MKRSSAKIDIIFINRLETLPSQKNMINGSKSFSSEMAVEKL